ncbi:MAG TPA: hypothetical protein VEH76_10840 [Methylocystis sp.]|nr:hypothetical protein [Methylocystis sp.]
MTEDGGRTTEDFRFLFRNDKGRIGAATWRRHALRIFAILVPMYGLWLLVAPYAFHDLKTTPFFAPMTAVAYAYALVFAFVTIFATISYVNLSAKRFRDRGRPSPLGLASLAPFAAFLAGAAHFFQGLVEGVVPRWQVYPFDAAFVVIAAWTIWELGFRE